MYCGYETKYRKTLFIDYLGVTLPVVCYTEYYNQFPFEHNYFLY